MTQPLAAVSKSCCSKSQLIYKHNFKVAYNSGRIGLALAGLATIGKGNLDGPSALGVAFMEHVYNVMRANSERRRKGKPQS